MTNEVIKQAAEAIAEAINDASPYVFPNKVVASDDACYRTARAAYEIFRADFVRQLESEEAHYAARAAAFPEGWMVPDSIKIKAALKAAAEKIK